MSVRFNMGFELAIDFDKGAGMKFSANANGSQEIEIYDKDPDSYRSFELSKEDAKVLVQYLIDNGAVPK